MFLRYCVAAPLATLVAFAASAGAQPQTAEDFFKGKTLRFTAVYEPGGTYDLYSRLLITTADDLRRKDVVVGSKLN